MQDVFDFFRIFSVERRRHEPVVGVHSPKIEKRLLPDVTDDQVGQTALKYETRAPTQQNRSVDHGTLPFCAISLYLSLSGRGENPDCSKVIL